MLPERTRPYRAILLDALGTLLELQPIAPALRRTIEQRTGVVLDEQAAERAVAAEIAYYRAHHAEGADHGALADLRRRCAEVVRASVPELGHAPLTVVAEALVEAIRFRPYPDVLDALGRLRALDLRLVVVSNWDVSLHGVLAETGVGALVHGTITSAELGARKPSPAIFSHALTLAGVPADEALHVGDSVAEDLEGAASAGIAGVLLVRGGAAAPAGTASISSLRELADEIDRHVQVAEATI